MALLASFILLLALCGMAMAVLCGMTALALHHRAAEHSADQPGRWSRRNLPERLLSERLRTFRIDGLSPDSNLPRSFVVQAKHAGPATAKARSWGLRVRAVRRVLP